METDFPHRPPPPKPHSHRSIKQSQQQEQLLQRRLQHEASSDDVWIPTGA